MTGRMTMGVVMTTCNGERYIAEQVRSILLQTRLADELVIADDASSDNTLEVVDESVGEPSGSASGGPVPITVLRSATRLGLLANVERGLRHVSSDVVVLADQDDVWVADKLALLEEELTALGDDGGVVFTNGKLVPPGSVQDHATLWDAIGFSTQERAAWVADPLEVLVRKTVTTGATMAFSTSLLDVALPLPPKGWHDAWLTMLAVLLGLPVVPVAREMIDYRLHDFNLAGLPSRRVIDRLRALGWPREATLDQWEEAVARVRAVRGNNPRCERLSALCLLHRRRTAMPSRAGARSAQVWSLISDGSYRRSGVGLRAAAHDALVPLLYRSGPG